MADWRQELEARCTAATLEAAVRDVVQREIEEHLQDRFEDLVHGGASAEAAARVVRREMPEVEAIRRLARSRAPHRAVAPPPIALPGPESRGVMGALTLVFGDLRYAWRSFLKDRTFTAAAVTMPKVGSRPSSGA